jgi:RNA polymerase sigma factor (sigma-70 family)
MRRARTLSVLLSLTFIAAFVLSVRSGEPARLPGVAMESALLLHAMRAAVAAALVSAVAVVVLRLWQGELPTKLSTTGAEWAAPLGAPARDVQEQLLRVELESRRAVDELARRVELLAAQPPSPGLHAEANVEAATVRWDVALDEAVLKDRLAEAIYSLTKRERLVISLSVYEGLTDQEVAEQLGLSTAAVGVIRHRSLSKLRALLGREPFATLFFVSFEGQLSDEDRKALSRSGWKLYENAIGSTAAAYREDEMPPIKWRQVVRVPAETGDEAKHLVIEALGREPERLRVDEGQLPDA